MSTHEWHVSTSSLVELCKILSDTLEDLAWMHEELKWPVQPRLSAAVKEAMNRLEWQSNYIASLEAHIRVMRIVAYNTTININGGVGEGDEKAAYMDKKLIENLTNPLPEWSYTPPYGGLEILPGAVSLIPVKE